MRDPLLRAATLDDVDGIERLVVAAFERYVPRIGKPPGPMTADYAKLVRTSRVWVVESTETAHDADAGSGSLIFGSVDASPRAEIVGVLVTRAESDHLLLDVIAIAPTAQGGGLGGALLARADADAREQGLAEIRLCTNAAMTENLAYYPRRGFRETGRGLQDGYHRVFFAKRLGPMSTSRT